MSVPQVQIENRKKLIDLARRVTQLENNLVDFRNENDALAELAAISIEERDEARAWAKRMLKGMVDYYSSSVSNGAFVAAMVDTKIDPSGALLGLIRNASYKKTTLDEVVDEILASRRTRPVPMLEEPDIELPIFRWRPGVHRPMIKPGEHSVSVAFIVSYSVTMYYGFFQSNQYFYSQNKGANNIIARCPGDAPVGSGREIPDRVVRYWAYLPTEANVARDEKEKPGG